MTLTQEQREWLTLALVPGVGTARFVRLLARFATPARVLAAAHGELAEVVGASLASRIREYRTAADIDLQEQQLRSMGASLITMDDPKYPTPLAEIYDPPLLLFARGEPLDQDQYAVAIVGTRRATARGLKIAGRLAGELATRSITVVSGMAEGIDTAAHEGALDAGGRTIAVLASGLDQLFPASNAGLQDRICEQGCILSAFPMGMPAMKGNFPPRNRVISGLCLGTLVVEAPPNSGALLTAKYAAEQGREVFAVPGPVDLLVSRGPHALIRDGARLVETVEDILVELNLPARLRRTPDRADMPPAPVLETSSECAAPPTPVRTGEAAPALSPVEHAVLSVLHGEGSFVDEIALACRVSIAEALSTLTLLELKGRVRQLSGKRFASL